MYLPIPSQPDCANAWLEAIKAVDGQAGHQAHNVIIDVADPTAGNTRANNIVELVDDFLLERGKSVTCIANTIFPYALYRRHGHPKFTQVFKDIVLPKVRKMNKWSGYYFERMIDFPTANGKSIDQLSEIIKRLNDPKINSLNKHELSLFDPERDVDNSPYGRQCLSYLSFKLTSGAEKKLNLTALYRNQYYMEKLLGNLIGLGRLMEFVAAESQISVGSLTVISTHAEIDLPSCNRPEFLQLLDTCRKAGQANPTAS